MNSDEFMNLLSERTGCDEKKVSRMVSSVTDIIVGGLQDGRTVLLQDFGTFEVKKKLEKIVVNPSTGKRKLFPPKLVVGFRPCPMLKEKVNPSGRK